MPQDPFQQRLQSRLTQLQNLHLRRHRRSVEYLTATECRIDGRQVISFATNDYLGLSRHPLVLQAFAEAASEQCGSTASALVAGRSSAHANLESELADFEGGESAVVFPSGFAANYGTMTALIGENDVVFCDRENHASLIDGCRSSAGKFFVYDRLNLDQLRISVERRRSQFDWLFIVTDSVFSMDGDVANLTDLCDLCDTHQATLIVDEAHATGVFGPTGRGVCELQQVVERVAVRIGTLSKALGGLGGFVVGSRELSEVLWNTARSQFFSTALPPAICEAARAALRVVQTEPQHRTRLASLARFARTCMKEFGLTLLPAPAVSPIIGVLLNDDDVAVRISQKLLAAGFFVPAIRPPTVARGTARLRFSLCSHHTEEQIEAAVCHLRDVARTERP
jgi:8-amino-7-oxononanoate synthase